MNLVDRYVYAVTKRLPQKQRDDIEKELKTLIDDMLENQQGDETIEKKIVNVLMELGDPELMADNYRETKRYLIGPDNFENYIFILKIVLGAVFLGITVSTIVESFSILQQGIVYTFARYLAITLSALVQGFAWVTAGFAIAEYNGIKLLDKKDIKEGWSIAELPEVPQKEAVIARSEIVFSVAFSTIFTCLLIFAPHIFAAYINNGSGVTTVIPVFNIEVLSRFNMLVIVLFILGVMKEGLKLYFGRWKLRLSIPIITISVISAIISVLIFGNPDVWNASFALEVANHLDFTMNVGLWNRLSSVVIIIIIVATVIDVATSFYKGIKYNS